MSFLLGLNFCPALWAQTGGEIILTASCESKEEASKRPFLSSANKVSTGPTCLAGCVCQYVFWSFVEGLLLVKILASGSGSGTHLIEDIVTSNAKARLRNATLRQLKLSQLCPTYIFKAFDWLNYSLLAMVLAYHTFRTLSPTVKELG